MQLRAYQSRIVAVAEAFNTVAVLPTGAGKTLVAHPAPRRQGSLPRPHSLTGLAASEELAMAKVFLSHWIEDFKLFWLGLC